MKLVKGIGASSGVSIAKVYELKETELIIKQRKITKANEEIKFFNAALIKSIEQLEKVKNIALKKFGEEKAAIFEAHIQIINDPSITAEVTEMIKNEMVNADYAAQQVFSNAKKVFLAMEDTYFKERASDVEDVSRRVLHNLLGIEMPDISSINYEVIIVSNDLTPSDTALLDKKYVRGFVTNIGGKTSHAAIMARSLEIPAVLGTGNITDLVKNNMTIAIDGKTGEVFLDPDWDKVKEIKEKIESKIKEKAELEKYKHLPTKTIDGHQVKLEANIGSPNDVAGVKNNGAEGVGLFRSEFLYMDSHDWPTEEEQFHSYKKVLEELSPQQVVIRTLDIGGDKVLSYYKFSYEMNPFLGYRAIRFCLDNIEIFKTQLRALIRSSAFGNLAIMFPMIGTIDEFKKAKSVYEECYLEVKKLGHKIGKIELGMMMEIPAVAVHAEKFSKYADFFSIGTNDLIQYSLAADRMAEKVQYLYQPLNPSILKLIKLIIDGGHLNKKWAAMCGEMAGDLNAVAILIGLGLDYFSMTSTAILPARKLINNINYEDAKKLAHAALNCETETEVLKLVEDFNKKIKWKN